MNFRLISMLDKYYCFVTWYLRQEHSVLERFQVKAFQFIHADKFVIHNTEN